MSTETSLGRLLVARGMTSTALAASAGIPQSTIGNVLGCRQKLSPSRALAVAITLGVEPEELADVTGVKGTDKAGHGPAPAWSKAVHEEPIEPMAEPRADKPWSDKDPEMEKVWLYLHQMGRRVRDCEARLRELEAK